MDGSVHEINGPADSEPEESDDSYNDIFRAFSNAWLETQLTHHVSLTAANKFWSLSQNYMPKLLDLRKTEHITRKVPQFPQIRNTIKKQMCPEIKISFAFLDKEDGSIIHVSDVNTPLKQFQRNPRYEKLYEEANIEVKKN